MEKGKAHVFYRSMRYSLLFIFLFPLIAFAGKKEKIIEIKTPKGVVYVWLYKDTPKHRNNFLKLAEEGYFDSTLFHRVIRGFMIQGGDPFSRLPEKIDSLGEGGPGYLIDAEFTRKHFHKRGVIAAARDGDDINPEKKSAGSQFYIVQGRTFDEQGMKKNLQRVRKGTGDSTFNWTSEELRIYQETGGTPWLDQQYTIFGEVLGGMYVVDAIASVSTDEKDRPKEDIRMDVNVIEMTRKEIRKKFGYCPKG